MPVPVPEDAMEVNALCEETLDPPDMEAFFDAAGEFTITTLGDILVRDATIAGIRAERVFEWNRKSEKPPNEKVISNEDVSQSQGRRGPVKNCGAGVR